jgi:hypothetical protein
MDARVPVFEFGLEFVGGDEKLLIFLLGGEFVLKVVSAAGGGVSGGFGFLLSGLI